MDAGRLDVVRGTDISPANGSHAARPTVSIIVTNYNYADYCGAAIDSALAQTWPDVEVIVVDDGSTDGSRAVIAAYESAGRARVVWRANGGQAAAMNSGFAASRGAIVMFLDADDMLAPEAAATVVAAWTPGLSRVQFPLALIDRHGRPRGLHPFSHHLEAGDLHWKLVVGSSFWFAPTSGNAFARAALAPIFPIPEAEWRLCADAYAVGLSAAFGPVATLPQALGRYRVHGRNNWYQETMDAAHRDRVRHQRMALWQAVAGQLRQPTAAAALVPADPAVRARAALALLSRVITTHHLSPEGAPKAVLRRARRAARAVVAGAPLPWREKLGWAAYLALVGRVGAPRGRVGRWLAHPSLRPAWLARAVAAFGGVDDGWTAARPLPATIAPFPLDRPVRFGAGQDGQRYQWYGWDAAQPMAAWGVGRRAALVGTVPPDTRRVSLALVIDAARAGAVAAQRIRIEVGGETLFDEAVAGERRLTLTADAPPDGWLVITFHFPDSVVPHFLDRDSPDLRPLGVMLSSITVAAERDPEVEEAWPFVPHSTAMIGEALWPLVGEGWHPPDEDLVRMARRDALLSMTLLGGVGFDHAVTLRFAPSAGGGRTERLRIAAAAPRGEETVLGSFDLAREDEVAVRIPRGLVGIDGRVRLSLRADTLVPSDETATADIPVAEGPGLIALSVERLPAADGVAVYPIGAPIVFAAGEARPFLGEGWRAAEARGCLTSDVRATIRGLCLWRDREIFLTAVVFPPAEGGFLDQTLTVTANGRLVAAYDVDRRAEITAIVPRDVVGEDRVLEIVLEVSILAAPAHLDAGPDNRVVGIGVEALMLEYA